MLQKVDWAAVRAADASARNKNASPAIRDVTDSAERCHAALIGLAEVLTARGFNVVCSGEVLCARNLAADPPSDDDVQAWALTPGLSQNVMCRPDNLGRPWFWWVWSDRVPRETAAAGPGSDGPDHDVDVQSLCAAAELELAADRVARVIAVRSVADV